MFSYLIPFIFTGTHRWPKIDSAYANCVPLTMV